MLPAGWPWPGARSGLGVGPGLAGRSLGGHPGHLLSTACLLLHPDFLLALLVTLGAVAPLRAGEACACVHTLLHVPRHALLQRQGSGLTAATWAAPTRLCPARPCQGLTAASPLAPATAAMEPAGPLSLASPPQGPQASCGASRRSAWPEGTPGRMLAALWCGRAWPCCHGPTSGPF